MAYNATDAGEILYRERTARHMSQKALADKVGVSAQTIGNYEAGKYKPDIDTIQAIADVFQITIDALVGRDTKALQAGDCD